MENKTQFSVGIFIYALFILIACSFLLFQRGVWLYLDLNWWPKQFSETEFLSKDIISCWKIFSFYGGDTFLTNFRKLPIAIVLFQLNKLVAPNITQVLFYLLSYIVIYYGCVKIVELFPEKANFCKILIPCLYAFNPVAVHLLSKCCIFMAYAFIPLFSYSLIAYFQSGKLKLLLLNIICFWFILYYPRITLEVIFLLFLFLIFFRAYINIKRLSLALVFYSLIFLGFLFPILSGQIPETGYISFHEKADLQSFLNYLQNLLFLKHFIPQDIGPNFATSFYNTTPFLISSFFLIMALFFLNLYYQKSKDNLRLFSLIGIIACFTLLIAGKFLPEGLVKVIYLRIMPFLAFNVQWIYVLLIIFIILNLISILNCNLSKKMQVITFLITIQYIIVSLVPLFSYRSNPKLHKIPLTSSWPPSFGKISGNNFIKAMWYYPNNSEGSLLFNGYPYPLNPSSNPVFLPLFSRNRRLANNTQFALANNLNSLSFLRNSFIYGLTDIFVFRDIRNPKPHEFDFFPGKDYKGEAKMWEYLLKKDSKFALVNENEKFSLFSYKSQSPYDFFIYNPIRVILSDDISILSKLDLSTKERPLILSTSSSNALSPFKTLDTDVKIEIKVPLNNPTKYYIKVSKINQPFLLHFNQTFSPYWKLFFINKEQYESIKPASKWEEFPLTNNKKCLYKDSLLEFENFKIAFTKTSLPDKYHLKGNFLGNTFLITNQNVPREYKDSKELYLVLLYKPQIYYTLALLNAAFALIVLGFIAFIQEIKNKQ